MGLPEVNYDWKGGGGGRNFIREIVRTRDNHTCQKCGKKWKKGMRKFDVNHLDETQRTRSNGIIKYDKENMDKLITFCHKCHYAWHIEQGHTKTWKRGRSKSKRVINFSTCNTQ